MRELTSHKVNGLNEVLAVQVHDEPGSGGACHKYRIRCTIPVNESTPDKWDTLKAACDINFQNGPIAEVGVNGISNEALLAVVEDRLFGFSNGPFNCRENLVALSHVREAMAALLSRTKDRTARGVEGTSKV